MNGFDKIDLNLKYIVFRWRNPLRLTIFFEIEIKNDKRQKKTKQMKHLQSKKRIFGWSTTTTTTKVHLNVYNLGHSYGWMTLNKYFISFCFVRFFVVLLLLFWIKTKYVYSCLMCMCFTPLFFICTEKDTLNCGHTHIAIFVPAARPTHFYTKVGTEKRTSWTAPKNCNHNMQTTALRIHTNLISLSDLLCQFTNFRRYKIWEPERVCEYVVERQHGWNS